MYAVAMANTRELWEPLDNESPRQFEGFKAFRGLPPKDRNLINSWRIYAQNPCAPKVPPSFKRWHDEFAWEDRTRAYDVHVERVRQRGVEKAIEDEARAQQLDAEKVRGRMHELLSVGYDKALEWMEDCGSDSSFASQFELLLAR
jgi:hypothetical protein